jgi:hypothetical protein
MQMDTVGAISKTDGSLVFGPTKLFEQQHGYDVKWTNFKFPFSMAM